MYRNHEHYIDTTAGKAIQRVERKRKGYVRNEYPWGNRLTYLLGERMAAVKNTATMLIK